MATKTPSVNITHSLLRYIERPKFLVYVVSLKSQQKMYKSMQHRVNVAPASSGWHSEWVEIFQRDSYPDISDKLDVREHTFRLCLLEDDYDPTHWWRHRGFIDVYDTRILLITALPALGLWIRGL